VVEFDYQLVVIDAGPRGEHDERNDVLAPTVSEGIQEAALAVESPREQHLNSRKAIKCLTISTQKKLRKIPR
jgi:hypothetical protein